MQTSLEGLSPFALHFDRILSCVHPRSGVILTGTLLVVVSAVYLAWNLFSSPSSSSSSQDGGSPLLPPLNKYEERLKGDLVHRHELKTTFEDLGGLSVQIEGISRLAIRPFTKPHLYAHTEAGKGASGVLLIGPPGTGKTMLAKAVAGSSKASFLLVNSATIQSELFGETPKLVEALFSLALKAAPCVVFLDEVDGLLSVRNNLTDPSHVNTMKTKFLECCDGLKGRGEGEGWVMVMGCTNRLGALDEAVLRRMPHHFTVGLPGVEARADILRVLLRKERVSPLMDYGECAKATEGYSGSDLKALVTVAVNIPINEAHEEEERQGADVTSQTVRELTTEDILNSLGSVKPTLRGAPPPGTL